jgi:transcriptional regulator with XRE-family HTH domain
VAARLIQTQVVKICGGLANDDPDKYHAIGLSTLKGLEAGRHKPRLVTAVTLATALNVAIEQLFPEGIDEPNRNPRGITHVSPDRPKGGRPRAK